MRRVINLVLLEINFSIIIYYYCLYGYKSFVLCTFRVALFQCYNFFMLHFFRVVPFSCCTFFRVASCCTLLMLHFLVQASNFIKSILHHRSFPAKFVKFFRTPISENICKDCFKKFSLKLS